MEPIERNQIMLITLINWIYVAITTYIIGWFTLDLIGRYVFKDSDNNRFSLMDHLICGFITVTMYAGFFSIFHKVGILANVILIIGCICIVAVKRKSILRVGKVSLFEGSRIYPILFFIVAAVTFVFAIMYTAQSSLHYDTGLYHAQSIHWIEDYGMVKGLGLLHFRLAYNSSYFPLCALYSLRDITGGQSLHSLSGYIALIVCLYAAYGFIVSIKNKTLFQKTALADALRLAPFVCFVVILMEISSPETDYVVTYVFYWMCIRYAELAHKDPKDTIAFALLSVTSFALIGYKLSSVVIVLTVVMPLIELIRQKQYKLILIFGVMSAALILPYLIRNYFLSGWLIYPFDGIDIFDVPWKIPKEVLNGDAGMITQGSQIGNRGIPEGVIMEHYGWLKRWWADQYYATMLFFSTLIMAFPVAAAVGIGAIVSRIRGKGKERDLTGERNHLLAIILAFCIVFWFIKGPAIRYGYSSVLTFPLAVCGCLMYDLCASGREAKARLLRVIIAYGVSFVVYLPTIKAIPAIGKYNYEESVARFDFGDHIIKQVDYPVPEVKEYDWNGLTCYLPVEGDQMWYEPFVSTPYHEGYEGNEWIGDDISDGFRVKEQTEE